MLIREPKALICDPILAMISSLNGNFYEAVELMPGVYQIGHFGSSDFLRDFEHYPETTVGSYGVCDSAKQLLESCPELLASKDRKFVVTLTLVSKKGQSPGGWRWHKWGEYIGTQNRFCEYLYDEPEVDEVFCFHIYEKKLSQGAGGAVIGTNPVGR